MLTFRARILLLVSAILVIHTALFVVITLERAGKRFAAERANALTSSVSASRTAFVAERNTLAAELDRITEDVRYASLFTEAAQGVRDRETHEVVQAATELRTAGVTALRVLDRSGAILSASPDIERFGSQDRDLASLAALGDSGPWVRPLDSEGGPSLALIEIRKPNDALYYVGARRIDPTFIRQVAAQAGAEVYLEAQGLWLSETGLMPPPPWAPKARAARTAKRPLAVSAGMTIASVPLFDDAELHIVREDRALDALRASLTRSALLVGALSLALSWILGLWLGRGLSAPVRDLTMATSRVAEGRWQEPIQVAGSIRELSALEQSFNHMQRELIRQREALKRAERTAAWQDAARRLAHEIKNTLTPLQLAWEGLRSMGQGGTPVDLGRIRSSADSISHGISVLRRFLGEFSELARWPEPLLTRTDLGDLAQTTAGLYAGQLGAQVSVRRDGSAMVRIDAGQVTRALANLIQNALDAGGPLAVVEVIVARHGGNARLSVRDNGPGMSPETLGRIFTPYFTTRADGTGLGLSIVERVAKAHGATLDVESKLGEGTTISLAFPTMEEDHAPTRSHRG